MIRLGELKAIATSPPEGAFASAEIMDASAISAVTGPALLIADGLALDPAAEAFVLESDLVACGKVILLPSISAVTGGFVDRGAAYVPDGQGADVAPEIILPLSVGKYCKNETPKTAFETAHSLWFGMSEPQTIRRKALDLSLGADVENGEWWLAGALSGVLGHEAHAEFKALMADPTTLLPTIRANAAKVRLQSDMPVCVVSPQKSAVAKSMLTKLAPVDYWTDFAAACTALGCEEIAMRYRTAAHRIWG
jgi:hypothetical protein